MTDSPPPHPIDLHVGARIRLKRKMAGISQIDMAAALGVTFQQVQKYEVGTNRISTSKLHAAATLLRAPIAWFFDGLDDQDSEPRSFAATATSAPGSSLHALMATREGAELALLLAHMPARPRFQVLALIRAFADPDDLAATG